MTKNNYNWWDDPKNKKEVDEISWWNHTENKTTIELPVAIVNDGKYWVVTTVDVKNYLGEELHACAQGQTKVEAIKHLFTMIKCNADFMNECRLRYQRWVPFRKGDWSHTGGTWFVVFGFHFYFRKQTKGTKYGWVIPFTNLNISVSSEWLAYRNYKKNQNQTL